MKRVGRQAWPIVLAVIMVGGCNGPQSGLPSTIPNSAPGPALVSRSSVAQQPETKRSGPLLYISDSGDNFLYVFSLPEGKLVQRITGFSAIVGVCSDKEGNVFVVDITARTIKEYAHGGKEPIAVLNDPLAYPIGCSADPTTGDLAVTNELNINGSSQSEPGNVAIYTEAKGKPKYYAERGWAYFGYDSYDGSGNLYVDGVTRSYTSALAILPKGAHRLRKVILNHAISNYAAVQWDGQYLVVTNGNHIDRFKIKGTVGTKVDRLKLDGASTIYNFWIQNHKIYAPVISNGHTMVGFYSYPRGGQPTKTILGFAGAFSATVSILP